MELVKQEFKSSVAGVAGRDVVNHHHHTHGRLLIKAERVDLNNRVQRLEHEFGEATWQTWKFLHRTIGVENIEGMCLGHRDQAETILTLLLERSTLKKALGEKSSQDMDGLTQLTKRNSELEAKLKQFQLAYTSLEARTVAYPKQVDSCPRCTAAVSIMGKTRRHLLLTRLATGIAVSVIAILGYRLSSVAEAAQIVQARLTVCEYEGKPFTVGSIIDNISAPDVECVGAGLGQSPQWRVIKVATSKKNLQPRRLPHHDPVKDWVPQSEE